jgi:PPK2 family polyphosphate:nucleotide phosphotransferase
MNKSRIAAEELATRYRVDRGKKFRLKDFDPADTWKIKDETHAKALLARGVARLAELQEKLYAQDRWAVLCIFQAMDAAGKDSAIEHVMSGINPQGCQVFSFKAPSSEDLDHDYLWRCMKCLPERGRIGIFNRSYYEETLVVRVHPELLAKQRLPEKLVGKDIWNQRFDDIRHFERYLTNNGVVIRKFFLHVSKAEQKKRFLSRLMEPDKNWKFAAADVRERQHWNEYMDAYEDMIRHTATDCAPWHVIPADNKWFTRIVVAAAMIDALEELDLHFPKVTKAQRQELEAAKRELLEEKRR